MGKTGRACRNFVIVAPVLVCLIFYRVGVNPLIELENQYSSTPPLWNSNHSYIAKLQLQHLETCTKENIYVRVCIVRNAVNSSALEAFMRINEDSQLSFLKVQPLENSSAGFVGGSIHRASSPLDLESSSMGDLSHVKQATVGELARGEAQNTYRGFASFNYSNYLPILTPVLEQGLFEGHGLPDRADIFAGDIPTAMTTAALHANQLEKSTTIQVLGDKLWTFVTPHCMSRELGAYRIGHFIAIADTSMEVLERCVVTTAVAGPGDVIVFPKSWPHQIYTLPGPNFMVNLRTDGINILNPADLMSLWALLAPKKAKLSCVPGIELTPTAFVHGMPVPKTVSGKGRAKSAMGVDLRHCFFGRPSRLNQYISKKQSVPIPEAVEASQLQQILEFHGRSAV